jgi:hypothetical protein
MIKLSMFECLGEKESGKSRGRGTNGVCGKHRTFSRCKG